MKKLAFIITFLVAYTNSQPVFILLAPLDENDTFQENANLTVEKLFAKITPPEYLQATREILSKVYSDFELVSSGNDYHVISGILNGVAVTQLQCVAIKNNTAYTMTYSSTPDSFMQYLDTFLLIQSTFKY